MTETLGLGADVSSTGPPGQRVDEGKGRIFPCPSCGSDLEFHIGQQRLQCPFCGHGEDLVLEEGEQVTEQDFEAMLARLVELRQAGATETLETRQVRCESCGALVEFTGSLTSTECAYCGSPIQREDVHRSKQRIPVDGVLPFQVDRPQAQENLSRWLKSRWFAPNEFKKQGATGKFNGVYLPFWTFDAMTFCRYQGERGEHYFETRGSGKNRQRIRHTRWYPAAGDFQRFFDDVVVAADHSLPRPFVSRLEPWPLERCLPFTEQALAGYLAKTYEVPLEESFSEAKGRIDQALRAETAQRIGGDDQRIHDLDSHYSAITYKHLLLPVWLLSYRYRDRPYQVLVNAASGQVFGQRPYSAWKITSLVLFLLVLLWFFAG